VTTFKDSFILKTDSDAHDSVVSIEVIVGRSKAITFVIDE
jgi:hypothetical protein